MINNLNEYNELLNVIREYVKSMFTKQELRLFVTFNDFYDDIDLINTYDDEWKYGLHKSQYKIIWNEFKSGKLYA